MTSRLAAAVLVPVLLAAACGQSSRSAQQRDARKFAAALQAMDGRGTKFTLTDQVTQTGGQLPRGQTDRLNATADGHFKGGAIQMAYRLKQTRGSALYPMRIIEGVLFAQKPHDTSWYASLADGANWLFPAGRVDLLRETILLATSESVGGIRHVPGGFAREYVFTVAPDQNMQLNGVALAGSDERRFVKVASGEVHVYEQFGGDRILRIELRLDSTSPTSGIHRSLTCDVDFDGTDGSSIPIPAGAQAIPLQQLFT